MARERGFIVEVTAFLPAGETSVMEMNASAVKLERLTDWFHSQGFQAVAVSSKFTSRKVEEKHVPTIDMPENEFILEKHRPKPDPMPDLDDSKFATNSGPATLHIGADGSAVSLDIPSDTVNRLAGAAGRQSPSPQDGLDIPAALDRRAKG